MIADGKHIAQILETELAEKLLRISQKKVCFVLFGNDPASKKFIERNSTVALRLGVAVDIVEKEKVASTEESLEIVADAVRGNFDGIVIQLPLPRELDTEKILNAIPDSLDLDVLSGQAKKAYSKSFSKKIPPVANAVLEILNFYNVDFHGKEKQTWIYGKNMIM